MKAKQFLWVLQSGSWKLTFCIFSSSNCLYCKHSRWFLTTVVFLSLVPHTKRGHSANFANTLMSENSLSIPTFLLKKRKLNLHEYVPHGKIDVKTKKRTGNFVSRFYFASGVPSLPWDFLIYPNDPAAHQDHCGRCRILTQDLCPEVWWSTHGPPLLHRARKIVLKEDISSEHVVWRHV